MGNPDTGSLLLIGALLLVGSWMLVHTLWTVCCRHDLQRFIRYWPRGMDEAAIEQAVAELLTQMNLREKVEQLSGDGGMAALLKLGVYVFGLKRFPNMYAGYNARLHVPPLSFTDGPRGVVVGRATCFPVTMLRGASWDPALEYRVGQAIGLEARAVGANYFAGLCVNLLRHPAWGRAQETYGEDSWHIGSLGLALMQGVQSQHVMVCAKHFAVNSIENSRFYVDVTVDARSLHEVYLPHFRRLVDGGVDSLMSAYNRLNGEYCGHHTELLSTILRRQWGFRGFVSSDWLWGIYDTVPALRAGMDVEMPCARWYGRRLRNAVWQRRISETVLDESVRRVLRAKLRWLTTLPDETVSPTVLACVAHQQLAQEVAEQSIVLLKNQQVLPWQHDTLAGQCVAVIGELATQGCLGDHGSSRVSPPTVISFLQGIQAKWGAVARVVYHDGVDHISAAALAREAAAVLLVVGYHAEDEGENLTSNRKPVAQPTPPRGGDRDSLALPAVQQQLLRAVCEANPATVVSVVAGSAVLMADWRDAAGAILYVGYPGMNGGHALARVLSGEVNPSGKLPFTVPESEHGLPAFDRWATQAEYGYLHGYTLADALGMVPTFAFGFGLSYTRFVCSLPQLDQSQYGETDTVSICVTVSNNGDRAGAEVLQCYIGQSTPSHEPAALRQLRAFSKVFLQPGQSQQVTLTVSVSALAQYDPNTHAWAVVPDEYRLWTGSSSCEADLQETSFRIVV